ncbi:hypothetical protein PUN4_210019 [Paraburkholderia unamae]|nr:hypothetical protein PUN4_210019 [Paraburkholderia unamae]
MSSIRALEPYSHAIDQILRALMVHEVVLWQTCSNFANLLIFPGHVDDYVLQRSDSATSRQAPSGHSGQLSQTRGGDAGPWRRFAHATLTRNG